MPAVTCPSCGSERTWRDGTRLTRNGDVQRFICRECGYRFSETSWNGSDEPERLQRVHREVLFSFPSLPFSRQICASEPKGAKNLAEVESRTEKRAAGASRKAVVKGEILEFLWHLKKHGRSESTIETYGNFLDLLVRKNVSNPEDVKDFISKQKWSNGTKTLYAAVYKSFAKFLGIQWELPKYAVVEKLPFIPTEQEIDVLIAGCGRKTATFLQLLKETGARAGEIVRLKWTDIDFERRLVNITPEKGSKPRILPLSNKAIGMLQNLPKKSERIFATRNTMIGNFCAQRRRSARKLGNPRLLKIHFHTLRHWKATMEYHKTKDVLHVMNLLGHRKIDNTMIYINLERALFQAADEEFHVKVAETSVEIKGLLEVGFEYVCEKDGLVYFRKRK